MKQKKVLLILILTLLPFCLYAAGLKEAYNCGQAAQMLQINADAYHDPAPTVEDILAGVSPYMPLTHMEGCKMLLRAFGPLPEVHEGIRYLVKVRSVAFTDVPEDGKEAVENLTNAGIYIPEDLTKFEPNKLMTEKELAVLVDRIHAYLQSSPKDDFYSWANADILNDPDFFKHDYRYVGTVFNYNNAEARRDWYFNLYNDTANKNIAALWSTYIDMEERENSMTYIQPMVDAIWNAADFYELMDVCADIRRETGIELLLNRTLWNDYRFSYFLKDDGTTRDIYEFGFSVGLDSVDYLVPGNAIYDNHVEKHSKLLSVLGVDEEEARTAAETYNGDFMRQLIIDYDAYPENDGIAKINVDDTAPFEFLPMGRYLERAGYGTETVYIANSGEAEVFLHVAALPQYLSSIKTDTILAFIKQLDHVVPARVRDAVEGVQGAYYAADPSTYYSDDDLAWFLSFLIHTDIAECFSQTEEYSKWHTILEDLTIKIKQYYHGMIENSSWLSDDARKPILDKLDDIKVELLVPSDLSKELRVEYVSAQDGGTFFENVTRFLKARYDYMTQTVIGPDLIWSVEPASAFLAFYIPTINTFFLDLSAFVSSYVLDDPCDETLLAYIGTTLVAHEISHAFDMGTDVVQTMPQQDFEIFEAHYDAFADYMSGYEFVPDMAIEDGYQIVIEAIADYYALKTAMAIASDIPGFDYDKFFRADAYQHAISGSRLGFAGSALYESHPTGRCRVNKLFSLVDEFYTTYDIKEGDAMYVAPENRPYVW